MRDFLIVFETVPENITLYVLKTDNQDDIVKLESIHNQYIGECSVEIKRAIMELENINGIVKIYDNSDTNNNLIRFYTNDVTIIVTGCIL